MPNHKHGTQTSVSSGRSHM